MLRKLWGRRWLLLRVALLLVVVAATGTGLYVALPPEPRWVQTLAASEIFDAGAGRIAAHRRAGDKATGPLQLFDAATGREVARFLDAADTFEAHSHSEDGRYFVALVKGQKPGTWDIRGVDLHLGREWQATASVGPIAGATFAPMCKLVALTEALADDDKESYVVVECSTGRVVARTDAFGSSHRLSFSGDGGCLVGSYHNDDMKPCIDVTSTRTGQTTAINDADFIAVSPDSRWLLCDRGDLGQWVWNLAGGCWQASIGDAAQRSQPRAQGWNKLLANNRALLTHIVTVKGHNLRRGQRVRFLTDGVERAIVSWHMAVDQPFGDSLRFSPDSRIVFCVASPLSGQPELTAYDTATGKPLWKRAWAHEFGEPLFTPDARLVIFPDGESVELLDAGTGTTERTLPLPGATDESRQLTRDGRTLTDSQRPPDAEPHWLWAKIEGWLARPNVASLVVRPFDVDTGAALGELRVEEPNAFWLTEDRLSLVTVYAELDEEGAAVTTFCCWENPQRRPLRWILTVPLILGMTLVALDFGWRWRRRRAPATAGGSAANSA
jgi:hypothetical protein